MAKNIISELAKKDLVGIWQYTLETCSEEQTIRYYNELLDECERIALWSCQRQRNLFLMCRTGVSARETLSAENHNDIGVK